MRQELRAITRMVLLFLIIITLLAHVLILPKLLTRDPQRRRRLGAKLMQKHLGWMVRACGLRLHIEGPRPQGPSYLLLSNHISYWDILALGSLFPLAFVAKDTIARWPV